jgi:AhpD family alkylhydroperoxidase
MPTGLRSRLDESSVAGHLFKAAPKTLTPYSQLAKSASGDGAVESKIKELMALSISITIRCEDCIVFHLRAALQHGATKADVVETIELAIEMGGGPSVVYGARTLEALNQLQ